ncbi:hypothetical protein C1645_742032 [Glomus cerebriforme]|uniref:Uncharacterized protein n=1 Tax=Glomus cerebriforme TaxID=658196 RepID=A0A397SIW4_9GLOM|nr:hypothetical protein C1645_742032 [Glomus cerebriforme]
MLCILRRVWLKVELKKFLSIWIAYAIGTSEILLNPKNKRIIVSESVIKVKLSQCLKIVDKVLNNESIYNKDSNSELEGSSFSSSLSFSKYKNEKENENVGHSQQMEDKDEDKSEDKGNNEVKEEDDDNDNDDDDEDESKDKSNQKIFFMAEET